MRAGPAASRGQHRAARQQRLHRPALGRGPGPHEHRGAHLAARRAASACRRLACRLTGGCRSRPSSNRDPPVGATRRAGAASAAGAAAAAAGPAAAAADAAAGAAASAGATIAHAGAAPGQHSRPAARRDPPVGATRRAAEGGQVAAQGRAGRRALLWYN
eukprot:scaffold40643_cov66-Phaeocystis_antarctica.AAC.4